MAKVFRNMKTTQELRSLSGLRVDSKGDEFADFTYRSRRSDVRHAYDDVDFARRGRSWKNFRRTKWRK